MSEAEVPKVKPESLAPDGVNDEISFTLHNCDFPDGERGVVMVVPNQDATKPPHELAMRPDQVMHLLQACGKLLQAAAEHNFARLHAEHPTIQ